MKNLLFRNRSNFNLYIRCILYRKIIKRLKTVPTFSYFLTKMNKHTYEEMNRRLKEYQF